jgi:hypothetical protein
LPFDIADLEGAHPFQNCDGIAEDVATWFVPLLGAFVIFGTAIACVRIVSKAVAPEAPTPGETR